MGFKMLDLLSMGPVFVAGFGYWLMKRHEAMEEGRLSQIPSLIPISTGDKELDVILGYTVTRPATLKQVAS